MESIEPGVYCTDQYCTEDHLKWQVRGAKRGGYNNCIIQVCSGNMNIPRTFTAMVATEVKQIIVSQNLTNPFSFRVKIL